MSVVDGPAGWSVGNKIKTLVPDAVTVWVPSGLETVFFEKPLERSVRDLPVSLLVNVSESPIPTSMLRTGSPSLSSKDSVRVWPPESAGQGGKAGD